jgi:muconolactone delta-isomerase
VTFPASGAGRAETRDPGRTDPGKAKSLNVKDHKIRGRARYLRQNHKPLNFTALFQAADATELESVLSSMALRVWRHDTVTPLTVHPSDPAAATS